MKLIIAIIRDIDDTAVIARLVADHFRVTRMASTGGFLRHGNVTLLIGTEADRVQRALDLIQEACQPPDKDQKRATVFVVNAAHFEQI